MTTKMETPLGKVRGLGSAHHGGADWWAVRLNSVALLLLSLWLAVSLWRLPARSYEMVTEWLRDPLAAVPMLLFVFTTFWHVKHGLRESIDDYVTDAGWHAFFVTAVAFFSYGGGAFAAFCVLRIAFGSAV